MIHALTPRQIMIEAGRVAAQASFKGAILPTEEQIAKASRRFVEARCAEAEKRGLGPMDREDREDLIRAFAAMTELSVKVLIQLREREAHRWRVRRGEVAQ